MTLPGPQDLSILNVPNVIWDGEGVMVAEALAEEGGAYYEVLAVRPGASVADLVEGFKHVPQGAIVRDAFTDGHDLCVSFWKD